MIEVSHVGPSRLREYVVSVWDSAVARVEAQRLRTIRKAASDFLTVSFHHTKLGHSHATL